MALTVAVVLNWRDWPSTIECVASLLALDRDLGVVVVDNDSRDGSLEKIAAFCAEAAPRHGARVIEAQAVAGEAAGSRWVSVVPSGRNGGYAYGNNVGMKVALATVDCRYVWILNADTIVPDAAALDLLVARMDADPGIGICGCTVVYAGDPDSVQTLGGGSIDARGTTSQIGQGSRTAAPVDAAAIERRLNYVNGACSFVSRAFIMAVGPMCEDYFLYFEEMDWAMRGRDRFRLGYCAGAVVRHHVGKSIGTRDIGVRSPLSAYYMTASHIRFCARHLRHALRPVIAGKLMDIARSIYRGHIAQGFAIARALARTVPAVLRH